MLLPDFGYSISVYAEGEDVHEETEDSGCVDAAAFCTADCRGTVDSGILYKTNRVWRWSAAASRENGRAGRSLAAGLYAWF